MKNPIRHLNPLSAFEITYVDLSLSNKQKRQKRIFRALNQNAARFAFGAWQLGTGQAFKILAVDEVIADLDLDSLAFLLSPTRIKTTKPAKLVNPASIAGFQSYLRTAAVAI